MIFCVLTGTEYEMKACCRGANKIERWSVTGGPRLMGISYGKIALIGVASISPFQNRARLLDRRIAMLTRCSPLSLHPEGRR